MTLNKKKMSLMVFCLSAVSQIAFSSSAPNTENTIGSIIWMAGSTCPGNAHVADGTLLPITDNETLFGLFDTWYGGDGRTTFALPDLRGRTPIGTGSNSQTGENYALGSTGGTESYTIPSSQLAAHTHDVSGISVTVHATTADASSTIPSAYVAPSGEHNFVDAVASADKVSMSVDHVTKEIQAMTIEHIEGAKPMSTRSPYVAMTPCVVMTGAYPARN